MSRLPPAPLPTREELAAILDPNGARPAPYWPQEPPPPGYAASWRQKDAYVARLEAQRERGGPDPRVPTWAAYEDAVRAAWTERMRLVERVLAAARGRAGA